MQPRKYIAGWSEHIDLPDWKIYGLRAKLDTGARTSALDVDHIEWLPDGHVKFTVVLSKRPKAKRVSVVAKVSRIAKVKSSPVHKEKRVFVKTTLKLGPVTKEIEINLVDRSSMVYRILLGRSALKNEFTVDVEHSNLLTERQRV